MTETIDTKIPTPTPHNEVKEDKKMPRRKFLSIFLALGLGVGADVALRKSGLLNTFRNIFDPNFKPEEQDSKQPQVETLVPTEIVILMDEYVVKTKESVDGKDVYQLNFSLLREKHPNLVFEKNGTYFFKNSDVNSRITIDFSQLTNAILDLSSNRCKVYASVPNIPQEAYLQGFDQEFDHKATGIISAGLVFFEGDFVINGGSEKNKLRLLQRGNDRAIHYIGLSKGRVCKVSGIEILDIPAINNKNDNLWVCPPAGISSESGHLIVDGCYLQSENISKVEPEKVDAAISQPARGVLLVDGTETPCELRVSNSQIKVCWDGIVASGSYTNLVVEDCDVVQDPRFRDLEDRGAGISLTRAKQGDQTRLRVTNSTVGFVKGIGLMMKKIDVPDRHEPDCIIENSTITFEAWAVAQGNPNIQMKDVTLRFEKKAGGVFSYGSDLAKQSQFSLKAAAENIGPLQVYPSSLYENLSFVLTKELTNYHGRKERMIKLLDIATYNNTLNNYTRFRQTLIDRYEKFPQLTVTDEEQNTSYVFDKDKFELLLNKAEEVLTKQQAFWVRPDFLDLIFHFESGQFGLLFSVYDENRSGDIKEHVVVWED